MGAEDENLKRFDVSRRSLPDGEVEVAIRGELDLSTAARLKAELDAARAEAEGAVIVDFSACGFIDSSGVRTLIGAARGLEESGAVLRIVSARAQVRDLFALVSLDDAAGIEFAEPVR